MLPTFCTTVVLLLLSSSVYSFQVGKEFPYLLHSSPYHNSLYPKPFSPLYFKSKDENEFLTKKSRVIRSTPVKNLVTIDSIEEFYSSLRNNKSHVKVVRFYAPWCKACAINTPSYYRLARRNPNILFMNISITPKNKDMYKELNISTVPFGQIYHFDQLVGEMKLLNNDWKQFEKMLKETTQGYCNLDDQDFFTRPYVSKV